MEFESMASLLFLALSLPVSALILSDPLITFSDRNPSNPLIYIAVRTFLFLLVPLEFISAITLLLVHVATPQSAFFVKHLTMATRVLVSATLLLGVPLMVPVAFNGAITSDVLMVMFVGEAAVVIHKCNPFKRYFNLARQTVGSFVPTSVALCISMGTLFFIDPLLPFSHQSHESTLVPAPVQLLILSLNCLNFFLAMVLLFVHISVPADGPPNPIHLVLIGHLVEATSALSFTTTVLIGFYTVAALLVGIHDVPE